MHNQSAALHIYRLKFALVYYAPTYLLFQIFKHLVIIFYQKNFCLVCFTITFQIYKMIFLQTLFQQLLLWMIFLYICPVIIFSITCFCYNCCFFIISCFASGNSCSASISGNTYESKLLPDIFQYAKNARTMYFCFYYVHRNLNTLQPACAFHLFHQTED